VADAVDPHAFFHEFEAWIVLARTGGIGPLNPAARGILTGVALGCAQMKAGWDEHGPDSGEHPKDSPQWEHVLTRLKRNVARSNVECPYNEYKNWAWAKFPSVDDPAALQWFDSLPPEGRNAINEACDRITAAEQYWDSEDAGDADDIPDDRVPPDREDLIWFEYLVRAMKQIAVAPVAE
jgi:hypothetical protein